MRVKEELNEILVLGIPSEKCEFRVLKSWYERD